MPGISFGGGDGGFTGVPDEQRYLLANSLSGTGTPPAAAIYAGDLAVLTTKSTLTSGGNVVVRQLLAADKTAHYKEGTPVAGILGVWMNDVQSSSVGVATSPPVLAPGVTAGGAIPYPMSESVMWGQDRASGRNYGKIALFLPGYQFLGRLDMATAGITLQHQLDNTLGGFVLNTSSGVTTYTIDKDSVAALDACIRIIGPNEQDPLYNTAVATGAAVGPSVYFEILPAFAQYLTGVEYSTQ